MKSHIAVLAVAISIVSSPALAQRKPCEELLTEIEAKIKANGVKVFTLEIVPADQVKDKEGKVVGSCDGATNRIVYKRGE